MGNFFSDAIKSVSNVASAATSNIAQGVKTITHQPLKGAAQIATGVVSAPFTGAAQVWKETGVSELPILNKATMLAEDSGSGFGLLSGDKAKIFKDFSLATSLASVAQGAPSLESGSFFDFADYFGGFMQNKGGTSDPGRPIQPIVQRVPTQQTSNMLPLILIGGGIIVFLVLRRK